MAMTLPGIDSEAKQNEVRTSYMIYNSFKEGWLVSNVMRSSMPNERWRWSKEIIESNLNDTIESSLLQISICLHNGFIDDNEIADLLVVPVKQDFKFNSITMIMEYVSTEPDFLNAIKASSL